MKKDDILKKYQTRVFKESVIKSLIYGLIFGLAVMAIVSLIFFIIGTKQLLVAILFGLVAVIGGAIYVYRTKFQTTVNAVAKRIDELGLHERVITMIDYAENDSLICEKQREDTKEKLEKVESSQIKFRIPKVSIALLGVIAILAGSSLFLPNRTNSAMANSSSSSSTSSSNPIVNSSSSSINIDDQIDEIIQKLIEEIRRIIDNADISDDAKMRLHGVVDVTVARLDDAKTPYEKIEILNDLKADIRHQIELMKSVGKSLEENDVTKELGQAIQSADGLQEGEEIAAIINPCIDKMIEDLAASDNPDKYIEDLIYGIETALALATEEENTELLTALSNFAKRLKGEEITDPEVNARRYLKVVELADNDASSSIEDARQEIIDALTPQPEPPEEEHPSDSDNPENPENPEEHPEDQPSEEQPEQGADETQDQIDDAIDDAIQDIEDAMQQQPGQEEPEEPEPGDQPGNGEVEEPGEEQPTDQPVFDTGNLDSETVIDGQTPYLDVFEEYYEEILEYLENNEVPDDLREVIEKYLEMIKNKV